MSSNNEDAAKDQQNGDESDHVGQEVISTSEMRTLNRSVSERAKDNAVMTKVRDTVKDLEVEASRLRLRLEADGQENFDCECEAVGVDNESVVYQCRYKMGGNAKASDDSTAVAKKKIQQGNFSMNVPYVIKKMRARIRRFFGVVFRLV